MSGFTLRPAAESDGAFLCELYASTREAEMAVVPWSADQKRAFVESQFLAQTRSYAGTHPRATHEVIEVDGVPAGRLYLSREPDRFHILDITISPERRNQGIGSQVLAALLEEASRAGQPVSIYVETFNRSLRLFQRLGFQPRSQDGFQVFLERPAAESTPAGADLTDG